MRNSLFMAAPPRSSLCSRICVYVCDWGGGGGENWCHLFAATALYRFSTAPAQWEWDLSMLTYFWVYQGYICHLSKLEIWELPSASKYIEAGFLQHNCNLHQLPTQIFITWLELEVREQVPPGWYYLFSVGHQQHTAIENGVCWYSSANKTTRNNSGWLLSLLAYLIQHILTTGARVIDDKGYGNCFKCNEVSL